MNGSASSGLPRPGPAVIFLLLLVGAMSIAQAILVNFAHTQAPFLVLAGDADKILHGEVWRLLTASVLTNPGSLSDVLFTLMGIYFLSTEVERRWGARRYLTFVAGAVVFGNLVTTLLHLLPISSSLFHPEIFFGSYAAVAAISVAFSLEMPDIVIRLFFFVPVRGAWLKWVTLVMAVVAVLYGAAGTEGPFAPLAGWSVGMLFGGTPSVVRRAYLNWKLGRLQKTTSSARGKRPAGAPALRVVKGGLPDESGPNKRMLN